MLLKLLYVLVFSSLFLYVSETLYLKIISTALIPNPFIQKWNSFGKVENKIQKNCTLPILGIHLFSRYTLTDRFDNCNQLLGQNI